MERPLSVRRLEAPPRLRLRLVPRRSLRVGALHDGALGLVPELRLHLDRRRAVGLVALPLWRVAVRSHLGLVLDAGNGWLQQLVARLGDVVPGAGLDGLVATASAA